MNKSKLAMAAVIGLGALAPVVTLCSLSPVPIAPGFREHSTIRPTDVVCTDPRLALKDELDSIPVGGVRQVAPYLHVVRFADSHTNEAARYYAQYGGVPAGCSARRNGDTVERNYDWDFDFAPEFVVLMEAGPGRFASAGIANVGTNLTERDVCSGKWSPFIQCLPGHTVDGVNEYGVVAEVNVVPAMSNLWTGTSLNGLGAVRWVLDHAQTALEAAEYLAANVFVPEGLRAKGFDLHFTVCDDEGSYVIEDGRWFRRPPGIPAVMTNFRIAGMQPDPYGTGLERYALLAETNTDGSVRWPIEAARYTRAYLASTTPRRWSEFLSPDTPTRAAAEAALDLAISKWATGDRESHRGETFPNGAHWWQTVHTSVYSIPDRTLRVAVQESDEWFHFTVPDVRAHDAESAIRRLDATKADHGEISADNPAFRAAVEEIGPLPGTVITQVVETVISNMVIETHHTNTESFVTNYYFTTNYVEIVTVVSNVEYHYDHWHTNYYDNVISNYWVVSNFVTAVTNTIVTNTVHNSWHTNNFVITLLEETNAVLEVTGAGALQIRKGGEIIWSQN